MGSFPTSTSFNCLSRYVDLDKGWDLTLINPWFTERGYEFVGYLALFSENELSGIFVAVERTWSTINCTGISSEGVNLDDMRFLHGWAHQFIWDSEDKKCYIVNIAE